MPTPLKPLPDAVDRWIRRATWLRRLDAIAAWVAVWIVVALLLRGLSPTAQAVLAGLMVTAGAFIPGLSARCRPVSGTVALAVSRHLRPGDRAWQVSPDDEELVVVTARRGLGAVVARLARGPVEGVAVRRTQVLLIPAD